MAKELKKNENDIKLGINTGRNYKKELNRISGVKSPTEIKYTLDNSTADLRSQKKKNSKLKIG